MVRNCLLVLFIFIGCTYSQVFKHLTDTTDQGINPEYTDMEDDYAAVVDIIRSKKEYLIQCYGSIGKGFDSERRESSLNAFVEKKRHKPSEIRFLFNSIAAEAGLLRSRALFITDSILVHLFVSLLQVRNPGVQIHCAEILIRDCSPTLVQKYSTEIATASLPYISAGQYPIFIHLLCMTHLNMKDKELLMGNKSLKDLHRARLGDEKKERLIIQRYKNAQNFEEKQKMIEDLVYIGSSTATAAFLDDFSECILSVDSSTSLRYVMLRGLERIYPDNDLFHIIKNVQYGEEAYLDSVAIAKLSELSDKERQFKIMMKSIARETKRRNGIKATSTVDYKPLEELFKQIAAWTKQTYGITLGEHYCKPFIYRRNE
ncbi:MAG: hypothetical protein JW795_15080 [Chitinivibrionales bacterium]|nr:hypothetical protein [Chitinivibrionales bacterium]